VNRIFIGGNDGAALSETSFLMVSEDRGATWTEVDLDTLTGGDTADLIVTSINSICDYIWVTLSDTVDPATATTGAVAYSTDGGATWTVPATIAAALFTTFALNGVPYVAGQGGAIYGADDFVNWTQVAQTATTEDFLGSAVDEDESLAYIVGTAGAAVVYDGSAVVDISAPLAALAVPPTILYDVHVLERNRIQVSGATGFLAESQNGGTSWTALNVAGAAGDVFALAGDGHRVLASADGTLYSRSILSKMLYDVVDYKYDPTLTGDLVELSPLENQNYFVGVLTTGEVLLIKKCGDDYCAHRAVANS
jgi:photosystem II stability/assembly factor-like uncharacterized protein